jgi:integrase
LNPGFPASQASVMIQTRPRAPRDTGFQRELKPISPDIAATIEYTITQMHNDGLSAKTTKAVRHKLRQLAREVNLRDPEAVKTFISNAKNEITKQPLLPATKNRFAYSYQKYCEKQVIKWTRPWYKDEAPSPLIPTPENVNAIIASATKRFTPIFTLLAEIASSPQELSNVTQKDINKEKGEISIRGCKGHASASYKLKPNTAEMLRVYLNKNPQEHPFPTSDIMSDVWRQTRRRAIAKLCKPELANIPLKNLRNYSGAQLYLNSPVRDPIAVMRHLRHKKLETTMHYLRHIVLDADPTYTCRTAQTPDESAKLIEEGFEYVTGTFQDGGKQFRKRKYT